MGIDANKTTSIGWTHIKTAAQVVQAFYARTRWLFVFTVLTRSISRLLQLLTFFLPLKIIILASYEPPPNWLPEYVGFGAVEGAIFLLIGGFVILYGVYLSISVAYHKLFNADALAQLEHGDLILTSANISKNKIKQLHKKITSISSDAVILALGLASIAIASHFLAIFILGICILYYITSSTIKKLSDGQGLIIGGMSFQQANDYVSSIYFLVFFAGLISGILIAGLNIFVAIFILIIARALIQAMQRILNEMVDLHL
jgi:hypothetical protein